MQITPLSPALGAEITGVDVADMDEATFAEVRDAFHENQLVVFRDQKLDPDSHIAFSRRFGELEIHISADHLLGGHPEILVLSNRKVDGKYVGVENAGDYWHSDLSYMDKPSLGSLLYALEVPDVGGDTEWSNMYAAYDTLSDEMKRRIEGLRARHSFNRMRNPRVGVSPQRAKNAAEHYAKISPPDVIHPIARTHPVTGRKALYVSPRFTLGIKDMDDAEAQPLLDELFVHIANRDFVYHHKWRDGDLVMWDNRSTIHLACHGVKPPEIRCMHRTTVLGEIPF